MVLRGVGGLGLRGALVGLNEAFEKATEALRSGTCPRVATRQRSTIAMEKLPELRRKRLELAVAHVALHVQPRREL